MAKSKMGLFGLAGVAGVAVYAGFTGKTPGGDPQELIDKVEARKQIQTVSIEVPKQLDRLRQEEGIEKSPDDFIQFCFPGEEGRRCIDRQTLLAKSDSKQVASLLESLSGKGPETMRLSHPTDYQRPAEVVKGCSEFNAMKAKGWEAVSSADMSDEGYFTLRCGLMKLAQKARVPATSNFLDGRLTSEDLRDIAEEKWPRFGEAPIGIDSISTPVDGVWVVSNEINITILSEIAHADFTDDGVADVLVFMLTKPLEGSAKITNYAVIENKNQEVILAQAGPY